MSEAKPPAPALDENMELDASTVAAASRAAAAAGLSLQDWLARTIMDRAYRASASVDPPAATAASGPAPEERRRREPNPADAAKVREALAKLAKDESAERHDKPLTGPAPRNQQLSGKTQFLGRLWSRK
jgi:hypothetical protein